MNRDTLNLNTFDPLPMALGERTTRLPDEPVNPRAAFEAFERGDHQVDSTVTVKITGNERSASATIEGKVFQELTKRAWPTFSATAKPVNATPEYDARNQMERLARQHYEKFGREATKRVILDVGGSQTLRAVSYNRIAAVSSRLLQELRGPEDDDQGDGEGDTPDIMGRVFEVNVHLNPDTYSKIRRCFLEDGEAIDREAKPGSPTMRFVQALERAVRENERITLSMCHVMIQHQTRAGRDVACVMRSFGINDTRELGVDEKLRKAFFACLANVA